MCQRVQFYPIYSDVNPIVVSAVYSQIGLHSTSVRVQAYLRSKAYCSPWVLFLGGGGLTTKHWWIIIKVMSSAVKYILKEDCYWCPFCTTDQIDWHLLRAGSDVIKQETTSLNNCWSEISWNTTSEDVKVLKVLNAHFTIMTRTDPSWTSVCNIVGQKLMQFIQWCNVKHDVISNLTRQQNYKSYWDGHN